MRPSERNPDSGSCSDIPNIQIFFLILQIILQ